MKTTLFATSTLAALLAAAVPVDSASARDGIREGEISSRHFAIRHEKPRHDDYRHHDGDRHRHDHHGYDAHRGDRHGRHDGRYGDHQCYRPDYRPSPWCGTGWCGQPHSIRPGLHWNGTFYFN